LSGDEADKSDDQAAADLHHRSLQSVKSAVQRAKVRIDPIKAPVHAPTQVV